MNYEQDHNNYPLSLKDKLRNSLCLYCCFPTRRHSLSPSSPSEKASLVRSSSIWIRSRAAEIIGPRHSPSSSDFRYDPLSYALNFDGSDDVDQAPLRSFSVGARSPSPMILKPVPETKEVTSAW